MIEKVHDSVLHGDDFSSMYGTSLVLYDFVNRLDAAIVLIFLADNGLFVDIGHVGGRIRVCLRAILSILKTAVGISDNAAS